MTRDELILCLFDLSGLSICEFRNNVSLITVSIALLVWYFCIFLTSTNRFPEDSVKYVGSSPITHGISRSRVLIPAFIVDSGILKMGTIPV